MTDKKNNVSSPSKSRIITLDDIECSHINEKINAILNIIEEDKKKKTTATNKLSPIKLIINSYGGDIYAAFGLIDLIKISSTPIHTICLGAAMSAGFLVFITGHKRYASYNSTFMYHDISTDISGTFTSLKRNQIEMERIVNIMDNHVIDCTKLDKNMLDLYKEKNIDKYFDFDEAKELGIIDELYNIY